jgi:hypothetical protein
VGERDRWGRRCQATVVDRSASAACQSIATSRSSPSGIRLAGTVLPGYSSGSAAAGTGLPTWIW